VTAETPAVCGLPLEGSEDIGQPVAALVIVKTFDADSEVGVCYQVRATGGLSTVEALGMADYAVLRIRDGLRRGGEDGEP
jgi:hypothetical protein